MFLLLRWKGKVVVVEVEEEEEVSPVFESALFPTWSDNQIKRVQRFDQQRFKLSSPSQLLLSARPPVSPPCWSVSDKLSTEILIHIFINLCDGNNARPGRRRKIIILLLEVLGLSGPQLLVGGPRNSWFCRLWPTWVCVRWCKKRTILAESSEW